jgi:glutaredoxin
MQLPKKNTITIYSKAHCKYCTKIKEYFLDKKISYVEVEFDPAKTTYEEEVKTLKSMTLMNTFPMIYIDEKCVGGYSDFIERESEYLQVIGGFGSDVVTFDAEF